MPARVSQSSQVDPVAEHIRSVYKEYTSRWAREHRHDKDKDEAVDTSVDVASEPSIPTTSQSDPQESVTTSSPKRRATRPKQGSSVRKQPEVPVAQSNRERSADIARRKSQAEEAARLKLQREREAEAAARLKREQDREAKEAARRRHELERQTEEAARLRREQEREAEEAARLKHKQEREAEERLIAEQRVADRRRKEVHIKKCYYCWHYSQPCNPKRKPKCIPCHKNRRSCFGSYTRGEFCDEYKAKTGKAHKQARKDDLNYRLPTKRKGHSSRRRKSSSSAQPQPQRFFLDDTKLKCYRCWDRNLSCDLNAPKCGSCEKSRSACFGFKSNRQDFCEMFERETGTKHRWAAMFEPGDVQALPRSPASPPRKRRRRAAVSDDETSESAGNDWDSEEEDDSEEVDEDTDDDNEEQ